MQRWRKNSNEVDVFAGTSSAGNMDGMAARTECFQSVYLCVEFGHVVYVFDAQLKLFYDLNFAKANR